MTRFSDYATNTAFEIVLSKSQVRALNAFAVSEASLASLYRAVHEQTLRSLWDKGLLDRDDKGDYTIAKAGLALLPVLKLAGLLDPGRKRIFPNSFFQEIMETLK